MTQSLQGTEEQPESGGGPHWEAALPQPQALSPHILWSLLASWQDNLRRARRPVAVPPPDQPVGLGPGQGRRAEELGLLCPGPGTGLGRGVGLSLGEPQLVPEGRGVREGWGSGC